MKGYATPEGTSRFFVRQTMLDAGSIRLFKDLQLSSVGIGSYLGGADEATDALYERALSTAIRLGVNVIDSAINYRCQRSERSFGRALKKMFSDGSLRRDEVFICTKGGFFPFDNHYPADPGQYIRSHFIETGVVKPEDVAQGCHAMTPAYLEHQLQESLKNLGIETLDVYYIHNPETQLEERDRADFLNQMREAFKFLERMVKEGKIRYYGTATWNGFRVEPSQPGYLNLDELNVLAREAGGADNHFKAVQLPVNLAMPEGWVLGNQAYGAHRVSITALAARLGFFIAASAPLLQSRLCGKLPEFLEPYFPALKQSSQRALQFARSVPGVTTALAGMKTESHVIENLEVFKFTPLQEEELIRMFSKNG